MTGFMSSMKKWGAGGAHFGILAAFVTFAAFPFYWMLITTFKQTRDLLNPDHNPFVFHEPPTFEHLHVLFVDTLFGKWLLNTAFVGVLVVLTLPPSDRVLIPDWEESLPENARSTSREGKIAVARAVALEPLSAVD